MRMISWPNPGTCRFSAVLAVVLSGLLSSAAFALPACLGNSVIDQVPSFVDQLYRDLVDRAPDPQGQQFHTNQIKDLNARVCRSENPMVTSGNCEWNNDAQLVLEMLNSPEAIKKNGSISSNEEFVTVLYKTLLRRAPDSNGLRSHVNALESGGSRQGQVLAFLNSDEYRNRFSCGAQQREEVVRSSNLGHTELGVNGHPLRPQGVYCQAKGVSFDDQLAQIKNMGAQWYRFDVGITQAGEDNPALDTLVKKAQEQGIQLLPVLFPQIDRNKDSTDTIYQKSRDAATKFVNRYKSSIHVYELSNEQDVYSASGAPNGDQPSDYDPHKYGIVAAMMRGLGDGVHAADGNAKRIIDFAGWLHTGFFQRLESDHIPYDIVGIHWYQNMGEITCPGQQYPCPARPQHFNVIQRLQSITHDKPMWVTETNYTPTPNASPEANMEKKEKYLIPTLQRYLNSHSMYPFDVVMIYELLDEPNVGGGAREQQVGMVTVKTRPDGGFSLGDPKPAYRSVKQLFER